MIEERIDAAARDTDWVEGLFYGRVSGPKQKKEDTIQTQVEEGLAWAERMGIRIRPENLFLDEAVRNVVPFEERPGARALFEAARTGNYAYVVIFKTSRWSRVLELFEDGRRKLARLGVTLKAVKSDLRFDTAAEKMASRMQLVVDEWDRDNLVENIVAGKRRVARAGHYLGGGVPYGYDVEGRKPTRYVIDPAEAEVIRRAFDELVYDLRSCYAICQRFNREGIPTSQASKPHAGRGRRWGNPQLLWAPEALAPMLHSPMYKGVRVYGSGPDRIEVPVPHLAIVSEELWALAQQRLRDNWTAAERRTAPENEYLLTGKLVCDACRRVLVGHTNKRKPTDTYRYPSYRCPGHRLTRVDLRVDDHLPCPMRGVPARAIDAKVWELLDERLRDLGGTVRRIAESLGSERDRVEELDARLSQLQRERQRCEAMKTAAMRGESAQGWELAPDDARAAYEEARQRIEALDGQCREVMALLQIAQDREGQLQRVEGHLRYWQGRIANLSFRAKKHLVGLFVERIWVREDAEGPFFEAEFVFDPPASPVQPASDPLCGRKGGVVLRDEALFAKSLYLQRLCKLTLRFRLG